MRRLARLGAAAALLAAACAARAEALGARYRVEFLGVQTAAIALNLAETPTTYRLEAVLDAAGPLSPLGELGRAEAHGTFTDEGAPRPLGYSVASRYTTPARTALRYDHAGGRLEIARDGEPAPPAALAPASGDAANLLVAALQRLRRGQPPAREYALYNAREGDFQTYRFEPEGRERIATALGEFDTLRVRLAREGGTQRQDERRVTTLWLAPAHGWLPVQGLQTLRGKERLRVTLEALAPG